MPQDLPVLATCVGQDVESCYSNECGVFTENNSRRRRQIHCPSAPTESSPPGHTGPVTYFLPPAPPPPVFPCAVLCPEPALVLWAAADWARAENPPELISPPPLACNGRCISPADLTSMSSDRRQCLPQTYLAALDARCIALGHGSLVRHGVCSKVLMLEWCGVHFRL